MYQILVRDSKKFEYKSGESYFLNYSCFYRIYWLDTSWLNVGWIYPDTAIILWGYLGQLIHFFPCWIFADIYFRIRWWIYEFKPLLVSMDFREISFHFSVTACSFFLTQTQWLPWVICLKICSPSKIFYQTSSDIFTSFTNPVDSNLEFNSSGRHNRKDFWLYL